jgi:hypothetical protein
MMGQQAVSETSVNFYQTAQKNASEGSNLNFYCCCHYCCSSPDYATVILLLEDAVVTTRRWLQLAL